MAKKTRRGGRPRLADYSVLIRLEQQDVERLDAWIAKWKQDTGLQISRGVAVRQCLRLWLGAQKIKAAP